MCEERSEVVVQNVTTVGRYTGSGRDPGLDDIAGHREVLQRAAQIAIGYLDGLGERPVGGEVRAGGLCAVLGGALPEAGLDPASILHTLAAQGPRGVVASSGPRFFGYVVGGSFPLGIGADWLVSAWDQFAAVFDAAPAASILEQVALEWLVDLFGLSARPVSGGFTTGSTMAHFTALAAARHALAAARGWDVEANGLYGAPELSVIIGEHAHVSIAAALQYLGLGRDRVRRVAADEQGRMSVRALESELDRCPHPVIVCAQVGEINTGCVDPIAQIAALTTARGDWLHIDGAFGLWAAASGELRHLTEGIEYADSWSTDAHKILNVPYDCGIVLCAHPDAHRAAMSTQAPYTTVGVPSSSGRVRSGMDWVPEMARRARGVPVWAVLRSLGRAGVAELVERLHHLAVCMATILDADSVVSIASPVVFNQILIDAAPPGLDSIRADQFINVLIDTIRADGTCWLGGTRWHGRPMLRVSVANWSTTVDDIDKSACAILTAVHGTRAALHSH